MKKYFFIFLLFSFSSFGATNKDDIEKKITSILPPGTKIESIQPSEIPDLYKVFYGDVQPIYVSSNGSYFIYGEMFKIEQNKIINLTNNEIENQRSKIINSINENEFISFPSENEIFSIAIFTDVDCTYCRKLHEQIDDYNNLGISINYLAFPRSGIGTKSFSKMVSAWCSDNPKQTLTKLKKGKDLKLAFCDTQPVAKHYTIGQKIGISGTPAIITKSGELFPGYYPPDELLEKLKG